MALNNNKGVKMAKLQIIFFLFIFLLQNLFGVDKSNGHTKSQTRRNFVESI